MFAMRLSHLLVNSLFLRAAYAQSFPTTVELDLAYPHNETYAPTILMPLVFTFRNPAAWIALEPVVSWQIRRVYNASYHPFVDQGVLRLSSPPNPPADTFFFPTCTAAVAEEGNYNITWQLDYSNCTVSAPAGDAQQGLFSNETWKSAVFAVSNGGRPVDLTKETECPAGGPGSGVVFNVTATRTLENATHLYLENSGVCPILADMGLSPHATITAAPSPCAATFDAALVSSMEANITADYCIRMKNGGPLTTANPDITCPPLFTPTMKSSGGAAATDFPWAVAVGFSLACLALL
jgi:hypothetical protein